MSVTNVFITFFYLPPLLSRGNNCARDKKKWKSLSDMFRRLRKSHKQLSGFATAKKIKWLHFDRLSFLHDMSEKEYVYLYILYKYSLYND